jgi:hypothetical protein
MSWFVIKDFGGKTSSTTFSLSISFNNWAAEYTSQESQYIWSNWC